MLKLFQPFTAIQPHTPQTHQSTSIPPSKSPVPAVFDGRFAAEAGPRGLCDDKRDASVVGRPWVADLGADDAEDDAADDDAATRSWTGPRTPDPEASLEGAGDGCLESLAVAIVFVGVGRDRRLSLASSMNGSPNTSHLHMHTRRFGLLPSPVGSSSTARSVD